MKGLFVYSVIDLEGFNHEFVEEFIDFYQSILCLWRIKVKISTISS
jgi:hypothetical protein